MTFRRGAQLLNSSVRLGIEGLLIQDSHTGGTGVVSLSKTAYPLVSTS